LEVKGRKPTIYYLRDPFLRFYYRFIDPNLHLLDGGLSHRLWQMIEDNFRAFVALTFEELCREWLVAQAQDEGDVFVFPVALQRRRIERRVLVGMGLGMAVEAALWIGEGNGRCLIINRPDRWNPVRRGWPLRLQREERERQRQKEQQQHPQTTQLMYHCSTSLSG
jgi:hypothetical protein